MNLDPSKVRLEVELDPPPPGMQWSQTVYDGVTYFRLERKPDPPVTAVMFVPDVFKLIDKIGELVGLKYPRYPTQESSFFSDETVGVATSEDAAPAVPFNGPCTFVGLQWTTHHDIGKRYAWHYRRVLVPQESGEPA